MKVSSNMQNIAPMGASSGTKTVFTEKLTKDEIADLKEQVKKNTQVFTFDSTSIQKNLLSSEDNFTKNYEEFQSFLDDIGYNGKPIAELSQDEASELVSEDGIFGVDQTSQRIADFVINGAGGDEDMLRAGREGMLKGFKDAEDMWGGKLPDISQETMKKATELVDKAMSDLGYSIIDKEV